MQETWITIQSWSFLDIPLMRWLLSILLLFAAIAAQKIILKTFHVLTQKLADRTATELDNLLLEAAEKPASWLIFIIGIIASVHILNPPIETFPMIEFADQVGRIVSIIVGSWFLWRLTDGLAVYFKDRAARTETSLDDQLVPFVSKTLKIFIVITSVLVVAQNMGYSITGLIASLGIGGIAIAMAARDTIANVFGSIMILIDRPFTIGDWIRTSEFEGVVEEIGFRSTRIRTFAKTLINVPNSSLANMVIDNIHAMPKRRVKMRIGITYATPPARIQAAIEGIEKILKEHAGVDQDFLLVKFDEFEDSSLSIFLYYFTRSTSWSEYLQVRQEVNLAIMQLLETLGIEFAFPTRTVYLEQANHPEEGQKTESGSTSGIR